MPRINSEKFYTSAIKMYGTSAKGVNWASKKNQELRFSILLELLPSDLHLHSIVDAGCGFGDLLSFMHKEKKIPKEYIGIDSHIDMYSIASKNTASQIIIADICKDSLVNADFYLCSGALNILTKFETYQFIQNCYKHSKKAFLFNVLYGDNSSKTYNYLTKQEIITIAQELHVREFVFRENYLEDDITVGFFK